MKLSSALAGKIINCIVIHKERTIPITSGNIPLLFFLNSEIAQMKLGTHMIEKSAIPGKM